jgi:hypothetical protein
MWATKKASTSKDRRHKTKENATMLRQVESRTPIRELS